MIHRFLFALWVVQSLRYMNYTELQTLKKDNVLCLFHNTESSVSHRWRDKLSNYSPGPSSPLPELDVWIVNLEEAEIKTVENVVVYYYREKKQASFNVYDEINLDDWLSVQAD